MLNARLPGRIVLAMLLGSAGAVHGLEPPLPMPDTVPQRLPVAPLIARGVSGTSGTTPVQPNLAYPLARFALQIDPWGWRYSEHRSAWRMHTGVDFAAPQGTPVLAALAGQVVLAGPLNGYGLTVMLDHPGGVQTLYAHLESVDVVLGAQLAQGDRLGTVGMSGSATGPHLHFELRSGSQAELAHDPTPDLPPLLPPPDLTAMGSP